MRLVDVHVQAVRHAVVEVGLVVVEGEGGLEDIVAEPSESDGARGVRCNGGLRFPSKCARIANAPKRERREFPRGGIPPPPPASIPIIIMIMIILIIRKGK